MDRKAGLWIAAALSMLLAGVPVSNAAEEAPAAKAPELTIDQQVQMIRTLSEAQRQATVAANIVLTDDEATKFWPIYRDYRTEAAKIGDKMVALLKDYSGNFESMTDAKAKSYTTTYLDIQKQRLDLKSKYVSKFDKVLSPIKTARALQIEQKLDSMVDAGLAKSIPLVAPPTPATPPTP